MKFYRRSLFLVFISCNTKTNNHIFVTQLSELFLIKSHDRCSKSPDFVPTRISHKEKQKLFYTKYSNGYEVGRLRTAD